MAVTGILSPIAEYLEQVVDIDAITEEAGEFVLECEINENGDTSTGPGNAFKHMYWQAVWTMELRDIIADNPALAASSGQLALAIPMLAGYLNELLGDNTPGDHNMDLWNNALASPIGIK